MPIIWEGRILSKSRSGTPVKVSRGQHPFIGAPKTNSSPGTGDVRASVAGPGEEEGCSLHHRLNLEDQDEDDKMRYAPWCVLKS
ncbi:hypothetical protein CCHR01_18891 [Colletotrichum chrysophilum]|uniref:Uncharacterized protein n=1 Tax=Colletotrichum chrysophilum TaxID=1836956 RepID=A0AAD9E8A2_9PEZI|nr:hypothetical protein CCHR01_18891 [Colletotrichum chrysophilum]